MNTLCDAPDDTLLTILEASGALIAVWDIPTDRLGWMSRPAGLLPDTGPDNADFNGLTALYHPEEQPAFRRRIADLLEAGEDFEGEARIVDVGGGIRWMAERGRLQRSRTGAPLRLTLVLTDITARRLAEEELRAAAKARTVLIREMNHRMKNSLQMVASLVQLHRMRTRDEAARAVFDDATARVRAVAEVHRLLYQGDRAGDVDLAALLRPLAENVDVADPDSLYFDLPDASLEVPVEQAVPVGLIVNELVVNANRHAYAGGPGPIRIGLARDGRGTIRLTVADEGRGLPAGLNWRNANSLGMMLLRTLTSQIDGELEIESGPLGTRASVAWQV